MFKKTLYVLTCVTALVVFHKYHPMYFQSVRDNLAVPYGNIKKLYYKESSEYSPYSSYFQTIISIVSNLFLSYGCKEVTEYITCHPIRRKSSKWRSMWLSPAATFSTLVLYNFGLSTLDRIQLKYNSFLFGILFISIGRILKGQHIPGAVCFSLLLNINHKFIFMTPAYIVYLTRNHCLVMIDKQMVILPTLIRVWALVSVGVLSYSGFFIFWGQLEQIISELIPFNAGLIQSYWAPNFWTFYNVLNDILSTAVTLLSPSVNYSQDFMGLPIQQNEYNLFPSVSTSVSTLLTLISMVPCLCKLWISPGNPLHFVRAVIICMSCGFMFDLNANENELLAIIIPLSILAILTRNEAQIFTYLSIVAHYSLMPVIYSWNELVLKFSMLLIHSYYLVYALTDLFKAKSGGPFRLLNIKENIYMLGFAILFIYENMIHDTYKFNESFPFLPVICISLYCAIGMTYGILKYYVCFLRMHVQNHKRSIF